MLDDRITYAKPALWDQPLHVRLRQMALVTRLALRCAIKGHEWRTERPTRCLRVTSCRICGNFIGTSRTDVETCRWCRPEKAS